MNLKIRRPRHKLVPVVDPSLCLSAKARLSILRAIQKYRGRMHIDIEDLLARATMRQLRKEGLVEKRIRNPAARPGDWYLTSEGRQLIKHHRYDLELELAREKQISECEEWDRLGREKTEKVQLELKAIAEAKVAAIAAEAQRRKDLGLEDWMFEPTVCEAERMRVRCLVEEGLNGEKVISFKAPKRGNGFTRYRPFCPEGHQPEWGMGVPNVGDGYPVIGCKRLLVAHDRDFREWYN